MKSNQSLWTLVAVLALASCGSLAASLERNPDSGGHELRPPQLPQPRIVILVRFFSLCGDSETVPRMFGNRQVAQRVLEVFVSP
jgi:hypothetical protein